MWGRVLGSDRILFTVGSGLGIVIMSVQVQRVQLKTFGHSYTFDQKTCS